MFAWRQTKITSTSTKWWYLQQLNLYNGTKKTIKPDIYIYNIVIYLQTYIIMYYIYMYIYILLLKESNSNKHDFSWTVSITVVIIRAYACWAFCVATLTTTIYFIYSYIYIPLYINLCVRLRTLSGIYWKLTHNRNTAPSSGNRWLGIWMFCASLSTAYTVVIMDVPYTVTCRIWRRSNICRTISVHTRSNNKVIITSKRRCNVILR